MMKHLSKNQKKVFFACLVICIVYFVLFIFPNKTGSENLEMVAVFEPDEAVPFPYILDMIKPASTLKERLINFAFYDYYFYGYPVFGISALTLLPIKALGLISDMPLVMVTLRQLISVLPMLLSILTLVYWQTGFKDYRALVLLLLLLSIPAVVQNNFWWHPDSLAIFFAILVLLFLSKDNLRFGKYFYLAAAFCGFSAGTKGIGFYFFLTILTVLFLGLVLKKANLRTILISSIGFLFVMGVGYLLSNPILIYQSVRSRFFHVMVEQSRLLNQGYEVAYAKGFLASVPYLTEFYGSLYFLSLILGINIVGVLKKQKQLNYLLIFSWAIPLTITVFWNIHFKFQYWLPVFLPLLSSVGTILPSYQEIKLGFTALSQKSKLQFGGKIMLLILILFQCAVYLRSDVVRFQNRLLRAENNESIQFYKTIQTKLAPYMNQNLFVYHDVRMYLPQTGEWYTEAAFEMLNYDYIFDKDFDILLLMQSRIYDYTNPNLTAIDETKLVAAQKFYQDADLEIIEDYHFLYRDPYGLIYIKEDLLTTQ